MVSPTDNQLVLKKVSSHQSSTPALKLTATEKYLTGEAKVKEALNNLTYEIGSENLFSSKRKVSEE